MSDERLENDARFEQRDTDAFDVLPSLEWGSLPRASTLESDEASGLDRHELRAQLMIHTRAPGPATVLLAMEDPVLRRAIAVGLRRHGCRVIEAADGAEMLEYLDMVRFGSVGLRDPDLIVATASMEGRGALAAYDQACRRGEAAPVIFVAPPGERSLAAEANRIGADLIVESPKDAAELTQSILAAVRRR